MGFDGVTFGDGFSSSGTSSGASSGAADGSAGEGLSSGGTSSGTASSGGGSGCEFDSQPLPQSPGAECTTNDDCDSGVCVQGPGGKICTRKCTDCCPTGMACEQWDKSDSEFICVPKLAALCRPCKTDTECAAVNPGALCIEYADAADPLNPAWFCGGSCAKDADCPTGHSCDDVKGEAGAGKQCVKKQGACLCSARSINEAAATWCVTKNDKGMCKGSRKCTADGLGACDAAIPVNEVCDGADNDCNGKTDDDIAPTSCEVSGQGGACKGKQVCEGGHKKCEAPTPGPEICDGFDNNCDGKTDEGFPDLDADQIADCEDGDKDGDGVPDEKDCAPLDKDKAPNKPELCDGKDNDCDGQTDEEGAGGCTDFWQDLDKDGYGDTNQKKCLCAPDSSHNSKQPGDCNDGNNKAFPNNAEACDGADNDCNGQTDEKWQLGGACEDGSGACKAFGKVVCTSDGSGSQCSAKAASGGSELCDGADNDCNGQTDEGFAVGGACTAGKGECKTNGVNACSADAKSVTCQANLPAGSKEVCDGKDNDCDGSTDESLTQSCSTACGSGVQTCSKGSWGACSAKQPQCTSGPCCDGCSFKSSSVQCGSSSEKTTYKCSGSCGGTVLKYNNMRYCSGSSASCNGALKEAAAGTLKKCASNQQCSASGTSQTCKTCAGGCSGSTCSAQKQHVICVDPGYGGSEGGTVHNGTTLKAINLSLGLKLRDWLTKDTANANGGGNWKVVMTRTGDQTVSLSSRAAICNNAGAERHLSIHINAWAGAGNAYGVETLYCQSGSKGFCGSIHAESYAKSGISQNRGLKQNCTGYAIIKTIKAPAGSCMSLPGFLSTASEAVKIKTSSWQSNVALGYLNAIQKSFGYGAFTP